MPMSRPRQIIATIAAAAVAAGGLAVILSLADSPVPAAAARPAPVSSVPDPGADVTAPEVMPEPEIEPEPVLPDLKFGEPTVAFMVDQPVQVIVTRVTSPPPDPDWPASPGCKVVLAEVRITNQGTGPLDLDPPESNAFWVEMQYGADAQDAEPGMSDAVAYIDTHRLQPGKTARGTYAFEIPEDESQVLVVVNAWSGQLTPDESDDIPSTSTWAGKVS
jgi:hypothetical protein